jgi:hypothetical protein
MARELTAAEERQKLIEGMCRAGRVFEGDWRHQDRKREEMALALDYVKPLLIREFAVDLCLVLEDVEPFKRGRVSAAILKKAGAA